LIEALKITDGQSKVQVLNVLHGLGEVEAIVPAAAELLKDPSPSIRQTAVNLLGRQGLSALPHLVVALKDGDQAVRFTAVQALQGVPGDIKEALPALLPLLQEGQPFQRRNVVMALGRVGEPALPTLITCLKDGDNLVRASAADALRGVGEKAKKATPTLAEMALADPYLIARRNAVTAIAAIDPERLTDLFGKVKKHADEKVRLTAYQALFQRVGKKAALSLPSKQVLPLLIDATKDTSANVRLIGVQGLGALGADAKDAIPALNALLNDPDNRVRTQAQAALKQIPKS
jgi:HEAT repeat protein